VTQPFHGALAGSPGKDSLNFFYPAPAGLPSLKEGRIKPAQGSRVKGQGSKRLTRISHQDLDFWGKLAKQVGRSAAEA